MTEMLLGQSSPPGSDPWWRGCRRRTRWCRWCDCTNWAGDETDCWGVGVQTQ
jgi:hypothetical protein